MLTSEEIIARDFPEILKKSEEELNAWRLNYDDSASINKVKDNILIELKKSLGVSEDLAAYEQVSEINLLNKEKMWLYGCHRGNFSFYWNESGFRIPFYYLDSVSLLDIDQNHCYKIGSGKNYAFPYLGYWLRTLDKGRDIDYVFLNSMASVVQDRVSSKIMEKIDKATPCDYVSLPGDGQELDSGNVRWNKEMRVNNPKHKVLFDVLNGLLSDWDSSSTNEMLEMELNNSGCFYVIRDSRGKEENANSIDVIFSSINQLSKIKMSDFWGCVSGLESNTVEDLDVIVEKYWKKVNQKISNSILCLNGS